MNMKRAVKAMKKALQIPDYSRDIAEARSEISTRAPQPDSQPKEWRTVIIGLPIIRKLLNGEDVELETFRINLIPDDVLFNNRPKKS